MRRISWRISSRSLASRLESGSSISTSGGSMTMARAMATRCCWPPDNCPGSLSACSASRTRRSASSTRRVDLGRGTPRIFRPKPMFLRTFMCGNERVVLEHHAEAALLGAQRVDALVVEP